MHLKNDLRILGFIGLLLSMAVHGYAQSVEIVRDIRNISWGDLPPPVNPETPSTTGQFSSLEFTSAVPAFNPDPLNTEEPLLGNLPQANNHLLLRSFFGGSFSGSIPDYFFGDIIPVPEDVVITVDGIERTVTFRAQPVRAGTPGDEEWANWLDWNDDSPEPFALPEDYVERFYWSPHAAQTFAVNPGRVTLIWRSLDRVGVDPDTKEDIYYFVQRTVGVSSGSGRAPRKIYWTESRFDGPPVVIPNGIVQEVRVIHNEQVPQTVPEDC